jgi:hypothetical protein
MDNDKYGLHTIDYTIQGWDAIMAADMEIINAMIPTRIIGTLGETVVAYEALYLEAVDSKWYKAQADGILQPCHGLAIEGGDDTDEIRIHRMGEIINAGWAWGTIGGPIYLDPTTPGALTQTPPGSNVQLIGYALSATKMLVAIEAVGVFAGLVVDNKFTGNQTFQGRVNVAVSVGGTVDAITAVFSPTFTALVDKMKVIVRAAGANTITTPTFAPDGLVAKTIVKGNLAALAVEDVIGAGHELQLIYNVTADKWVLLNPKATVASIISRGGTALSPTVAINIITWRAPFACTVTNVRGYRVGGTGATINARRNGGSDHLAAALSLTDADTWMDGGAVQNTAYVAGDKLEIMIVSIAGTPTQIAIQVDLLM